MSAQLGQNYAQMASGAFFVADWDIVPEQDLVTHVSDHRRVQRDVLPTVRYRPGDLLAKVLQKLSKKYTIPFFSSGKPLAGISRFRAGELSKYLQK